MFILIYFLYLSKIMKVQLNIDDGEKETFHDFYINPDYIIGYFITITEEDEEDCVNIYFAGYQMTFKQEKHLVDYLLSRKDLRA